MTAVEDVKSLVDIVDLVSSYVPLTKSGKNFKANCPFHQEKTPSFFVFPERGTWRCFGACASGGDIFSFIQKIDNTSFVDVLRKLAKETGVSLGYSTDKSDEAEKARIQKLHLILDAAADYFHRILMYSPAGEEARNYLSGRGISEDTIDRFKIGLAPKGWEILKKHLIGLGNKENEISDVGLTVSRAEGQEGSYDRFRDRLMFPITNVEGNIIGFGARSLDGSQPKYMNSPQNKIFDKSASLYGIDRAKESLESGEPLVLVEGYMDVIQAHQSGFTNVVAIMGTSLTGKQLDLAKKYTKKYVLALDSDAAGAEATRRSLEGAWDLFNSEIIRLRGVSTPVNVKREIPDIKIANLGTGKDPDEVIRDDSESWRSIVLEAQPLLDYLISWEVDQQGSLDSESKLAIVERIFPLIGRLDNPFEQEAAFSKLARSLGETEKTLEIAAGRPPSKNRRASPRRTAAEDNKGVTFIEGDPTEDHLLGIVLVYGEKAWDLWESLDIPALPSECFRNPENAELWKIMTSGQPVEEAEAIVSGLAEQLRSKLVMKLDEKKLGRALGDMVKRLLERQIKSQEEEAALAISSSLEEDGVANLVPPEDIRQQFVNRIEQLRKLERSRWGRPLSGT